MVQTLLQSFFMISDNPFHKLLEWFTHSPYVIQPYQNDTSHIQTRTDKSALRYRPTILLHRLYLAMRSDAV
jgi:hypothetical protein